MASVNISAYVHNQQKALPIACEAVQKIVQAVVELEERHYHEAAIFFVDTPTICELHAQYFNDPSPTDCISFPVEDDLNLTYRMMGDVFVCPETALAYCEEHQGDPYEETTLYIVHGLLHLMGYDDQEPEDEKIMRAAEARHMDALQKKGLMLKLGTS